MLAIIGAHVHYRYITAGQNHKKYEKLKMKWLIHTYIRLQRIFQKYDFNRENQSIIKN